MKRSRHVKRTFQTEAEVVSIAGDVLALAPAETAGEVVTLPSGWRVTPGLVDLQVNGAGDAFPLLDPSSIPRLDALLAARGVCSWLLAVPSAEPDRVAALARAAEAIEPEATGMLGLHLEGPVLSPEHAGAHPPSMLRRGDDTEALRLLDLPGVRMVTVAPEVPGGLDYARAAMDRGIVVAAGHTGATYEQARAAIDAGVLLCTHLFNAMAPLHHRAPGPALAYLTDPRARVAFIADGSHLHPATEDLILALAGERALIVSDAAPDAGVDPTRAPPPGVLAGSRALLDDAVRRLAARAGFDAAIALATVAPAAVIGLEVAPTEGARADLAIWDADGMVAGCIRRGELVASSDALDL